jgi:prepilin-type N-terminal cleavage/methylation domain-containing protein
MSCIKQQLLPGFTLLELLISLALTAFLCAGALKMYMLLSSDQYTTDVIQHFQYRSQLAYLIFRNSLKSSCQIQNGDNENNERIQIINPHHLSVSNKTHTDILHIKKCVVRHQKEIDQNITFFIKKTSRYNQHKQPIFSLYQKLNQYPGNEFISNVAEMNICYLITHSNQSLICRSAAYIDDWKKIYGVSIKLLLTATAANKHFKKPLQIIIPLKKESMHENE